SDRSGLLFLISPPGYGKTTLMEYIASRLGVMFVKVNGPALGHDVTSLDPAEAPNATAREEVEKLNFGLEMGNNTMLYVDDVQHTAPEFLQKFISLCDSTRQIEGVWNGETKTYDLRGKRFAVIMGGNPYTESGERFQVPDMLANRADIYNLGDILSGNREAFEQSYIENALTSNDVTAPLVSRDSEDIDRFIDMAQGKQVPLTDMSYDYSSVEADEIVSVLEKLMKIRDVVLKVNQQYIESAGKQDEYRSEPPFQLQGSYRNMNSMAEKVASAMNEEEVDQLIDDHYQNEAQTLTTGAEQNLLKLAEIRGTLTDEQKKRWEEIKEEFNRRQMMGGEDDPVARVAGPLSTLVQRVDDVQGALDRDQLSTHLADIRKALEEAADAAGQVDGVTEGKAADGGAPVEAAREAAEVLGESNLQVEIDGEMTAKFEEMLDTQLGLIESAIVPLAKAVHQHFEQSDETTEQLDEVLDQLQAIERA
ncbi:MAG: AAA family ATPase, partial [Bradymonadaceae bacterium]